MATFEELGIDLRNSRSGSQKVKCPVCSGQRKNKADKSLSVKAATGAYLCHYCGWKGYATNQTTAEIMEEKKKYARPIVIELPISDKTAEWFSSRKITRETLQYFRVSESVESMPPKTKDGKWEKRTCINFNYCREREKINIKYRDGLKNFRMTADAELVLYNLDSLKERTDMLICEGEIDCMSFYQAGHYGAVSVPNGASKGSAKLEYLDNCAEVFDRMTKIIIAVDNDQAGEYLKNELTRRLGLHRCWFVEYPDGCKDANDVLVKFGVDALRQVWESAKEPPLENILTVADMESKLMDIYRNGWPDREPIGYEEFDNLLNFESGQYTTITGIPQHGKDEFITQILTRKAARYGAKCGMFNFEEPAYIQTVKIAQKYLGLPYYRKDGTNMNMAQRNAALKFVGEHFYFIDIASADLSIDGILNKMQELVLRKGIKYVLIGPHNCIEHNRPKGQSETEYIGQILLKIKRFALSTQTHVFYVAHTTKVPKDKATGKFEVPTLYHIAGCHDDQTEVLTNKGWIKHQDLDGSETVACFDLENEYVSYQKPSAYHQYPYEGNLIHFKGKAMDIMVTPNHRMVVKPHWPLRPEGENDRGRTCKFQKRGWQFIEASDLKKSPILLPKSFPFLHGNEVPAIYPMDSGYDSKALFSLIGWYVSEGWHTMGSFAVCQCVEMSGNLKATISNLKLIGSSEETHYKVHEKPMFRFRAKAKSHPELAKFIINECGIGSENKKLPGMIWGASEELKRNLFDALIEGDGSLSGKAGYKYHTCSKQLADDVSRLAYELGYKVTKGKYVPKNAKWKDRYVVYINPRKEEWLMPVNHQKCEYKGMIYCLTVPTGAYVTRRNGKVGITGNSANFYNMTDNGMTIYRNYDDNTTDVYVQKVKFFYNGKQGFTTFKFDVPTGRYQEQGIDFESEIRAAPQAEIELPDKIPEFPQTSIDGWNSPSLTAPF